MRQLIAILMLLVGSLVLTSATKADDAADIKAAQQAHFAAYNASDADAVAQYVLSELSRFVGDGGLLTEGFDKNSLKAAFDVGLKFNRQLRHLDVKVYGNAAVVTGYWTGTITFPDGTTVKGPVRHSAVWIKQGGQWKLAHRHNSDLITETPQ